jgi:hypothetical protein
VNDSGGAEGFLLQSDACMDRLRNRARDIWQEFNSKLNVQYFAKYFSEFWEAMRGHEALEFDRSTCGISSVC